jgi:hypothetical protein
MEQDKKPKNYIITTIREFLNENKKSKYQVEFKEKNRGTIISPFSFNVNGENEIIKIDFWQLYEGLFSFVKYGLIQFDIKADDVKDAIELAKDRLDFVFENGYPKRNDIVSVTGFMFDKNNTKKPFVLSFMEKTNSLNQFTESSYKTKPGDLLKYNGDGDGFGFWYIVDENGNRKSDRLKGDTFTSCLSDGIIKKY